MATDRGNSGDNRLQDKDLVPALVLKTIGWCLALWTLPLTCLGSFIGPHILIGAVVSGSAAAVSFVLASRLAAGRVWARWCTLLFAIVAIAILSFACVEMVNKNESIGAFVFPIIGIAAFVYLLYAIRAV